MAVKVNILVILWVVAVKGEFEDYYDCFANITNTSNVRASNNTHEDTDLDTIGLIHKYGYRPELHRVVTPDGYVLTVHRIPYGKDNNTVRGKRPVALVMHGLMSSSADFVLLGPGNNSALAYLLADQGYDVWLGNARGNYYSRNHTSLDPNSTKFWGFSWEQIGFYDISATVDYILRLTGQPKLHYIGHSQGGTVFLVLNSLNPEYNHKFISFHGLAPAAYFTYNPDKSKHLIALFMDIIEKIVFFLANGELGSRSQVKCLVKSICQHKTIFDRECVERIIELVFPDMTGFNKTMIPVFISHTPAGSSVRQITHFAQSILQDTFARFNYGPFINRRLYGSVNPPEFDVSQIKVPTYLYYSMGDKTVYYKDLLKLASKLGNIIEIFKVKREAFNHHDFIWGNHAQTELYDAVIARMKEAEQRSK